ncbi:hypothetical protein D9M71_500910 [compost metagenome]
MVLERDAGQPRADQQQNTGSDEAFAPRANQAHAVVDQRSCQGQREGNQPHPADRREPGQRAIELAVPGIQPREACQEPAAEGFLADPQRCEGQGVGQRRFISA